MIGPAIAWPARPPTTTILKVPDCGNEQHIINIYVESHVKLDIIIAERLVTVSLNSPTIGRAGSNGLAGTTIAEPVFEGGKKGVDWIPRLSSGQNDTRIFTSVLLVATAASKVTIETKLHDTTVLHALL